jgi:hypothetical protein
MFITTIEYKSRLKIRERFVELLKVHLVIKPLQYVFKRFSERQLTILKKQEQGTIGFDLAQLLIENKLTVIPRFENHDLKHLILGYGMTSMDEIRMQAYLFGNGNRSLFCVLFLASGCLFPEEWKSFYSEYRKGKNAPSILKLKVTDCMSKPTSELIKLYRSN